jgi:uncharacterized repeat protein (TIGR01451 family)
LGEILTSGKQSPAIQVGRIKFIVLAIWLALTLLSTAKVVLNRSNHLTHNPAPSIGWRRSSSPIQEGLTQHVVVIDQRHDRIYALGGKTDGGVVSDKAYYASLLADGATAGWDSCDMPARLYCTAGVASQGRIYLAGGYDVAKGTYTSSVYTAYPDSSTGQIKRWYELTSSLSVSVVSHSLIASGDYLYLIGGQTVVPSAASVLADVYYAKLDPIGGSVGTWVTATSLLTPTAGHSSVVYNKRLYVVGGFTEDPPGNYFVLKTVVYGEINSVDGTVKAWAPTHSLTTPLYNHATVVSGDYIYVIGGYDNGQNPSSAVYRAHIEATGALSAWKEVTQTTVLFPPLHQHGAAASSSDGSIYVVGGKAAYDMYSNRTYYAPAILLSKLADPPGTFYVDDRVTYTILFTSTGIRAFDNVLITDSIPGSTSLITASISATIKPDSHLITPSWNFRMVTWTIPYLNELVTGRASFQVEVIDPFAADTSTSAPTATLTIWPSTPTPISTVHASYTTWPHTLTHLKMAEQGRISSILKPNCDADLRLEKNAVSDLVVAGQALTYTLHVYNDGPAEAQNVVVVDDLPDDVAFKSATPDPSSINPLKWSLGSIHAGGSMEIQLVVQVDPGASGTLTNTAVVDSSTPDYVPGNDQDEEWTLVVSQADLEITKIDSSDPITPGETLTYTLIITNQGPSDAQDVHVLDYLPPELEVTATTPITVSGPSPLEWNLDSLLADQSQEIQIVATLNPDSAGVMLNVAILFSDIDTFPLNNVDTEWTAIGSLADLRIGKIGDPDTVNAGRELTYTLLITNDGPSEATNVTVTDTLPAGVCNWGPLPPNCGRNPFVCNLGTVSARESAGIRIWATVCPSSTGTLINEAVVKSDVPDSTPGNNQAQEITAIDTLADLRLEKSHSPCSVIAGDILTYSLRVRNEGPSNAVNVIVTDSLPAGTSFITATRPFTVHSGVITWYTPTLPSGQSWELELVVRVDSGSTDGILTNTAGVTSSTPDDNPTNDKAQDWIKVYTLADLRIEKDGDRDKVASGETLVYTLRVNNAGPSDAHNVVVKDILPDDVTFRSSVPALTNGLDSLTWRQGRLTATEVWTIEITVGVNSSASGLLINAVSANSGVFDPDPLNNEDVERTYAPVPVTNRAYICESGRWCKESNTVINSQFTFYLPLVLKAFIPSR